MLKLPDHLKEAIRAMPPKAKDSLLLRLVAKDELLVEKLTFELIEGKATVEERREATHDFIDQRIPPAGKRYLSPGVLMMNMRESNGRITRHVRITKDRLGEITLTVQLLKTVFERHWAVLERANPWKIATFAKYVIARLKFIFKKAEKIHEDYYLEFGEDLQQVLDYTYQLYATASLAQEEEIPRSWQ